MKTAIGLGQLAVTPTRPTTRIPAHVGLAANDFAKYAQMSDVAASYPPGTSTIGRARMFVAQYLRECGRLPTAPQVMTGADVGIKVAQRALREAA